MDLNLVRVFVAVYETRNLTRAGERLYVTQSAVSQAMRRLREQLDNELFERDGRGMHPTPLAEALYPDFRLAMTSVDHAIDSARGFDASQSTRTFRIALSELGEIGWLPEIAQRFGKLAPRALLEVAHPDSEDLTDWLRRGAVDLAISATHFGADFEHVRVKNEAYVAVMSRESELSSAEALTMDMYRAADRVIVSTDAGVKLLETMHRRIGIDRTAAVRTQQFATLPLLLTKNPRFVAAVPETIAAGWATTWPIARRELPFDMPPLELMLYRRSTTQQSAALRWFYATVADVVQRSGGDFTAIRGALAG